MKTIPLSRGMVAKVDDAATRLHGEFARLNEVS
jgi:hypothetical protein